MIRFIDLGDQILEDTRQFAWFDTITDTFETFNGSEAWDDWQEFEEDYKVEPQENIGDMRPLERYKSLFPKEWP